MEQCVFVAVWSEKCPQMDAFVAGGSTAAFRQTGSSSASNHFCWADLCNWVRCVNGVFGAVHVGNYEEGFWEIVIQFMERKVPLPAAIQKLAALIHT